MDHSLDVQIRPAQAADQAAIRAMICKTRINPLGLDWQRFVVAVDQEDNLIGCGQIKKHRDGSYELASIAVEEDWRNRGVASRLIHHLLKVDLSPIWLMCRSDLVPFYEKFNFDVVYQNQDVPPYFQRMMKLWNVLGKLRGGRRIGNVMVWSVDKRKQDDQLGLVGN